ncbi:hypothetical protein [Psychrobacillus soli]|uniref:Uncharacterized protein n=1 Tax=Psychrobacillus soli TaxID=1543965 RepID=A0A544TFC6_9BACI|nr:hypothetical protein [Psychrobacillus soli]TQR16154.1 hypothetical protein FG383_07605 [Psychrobacillus soli]
MKAVTKIDKNLQSKDPFIRGMYEDLEERIQYFERNQEDKTAHINLRDLSGVTLIMGLITTLLILTIL